MTVLNEDLPRKTRVYRSAVRAAAASETRRRIVDAALASFTADGYAATTLRAIAQRARVSVETVNGHGPKRDLLFAAFELAFAEREGREPMGERADFAATAEVVDARAFLAALVNVTTDAFARSAGIWRAVNAAADVDPAVAETLADLVARRRREFAGLVRAYGERGGTVPSDIDAAVDVLSLVVSHESFTHLVETSGWARARFERWAAATAVAQLEALAAEERGGEPSS
ncbi:regulatory TetR family protein [Diaminobutyricimonas aerilata]|uniref:Regulatory TetR family protein n=1 Tax=Diaminobutyricimonas aerilata TaxID=1162967 RepID=A0A2M9CN50_9MICO|nr:TetR/AcrR family transcriptional regulator [Diaminobutyricimonas aerilata]PJJ73321.1 regulatory TetR family protein [Diaminobutyricimonas aerilata]